MPQRILVVDDDERTVQLVTMYLEHAGFEVLGCSDGRSAVELAREHRPALVVLDLMLPGLNGFEVCRQIRGESAVPIIMLTARASEDDTLRGLGGGADDYLTKPFSPRELVARVLAVLRRHGLAGVQKAADIEIDRDRRRVTVGDRAVDLTVTEFNLLSLLAASPGRVYSRSQLVDRLRQGGDDVLERTVDAHVMHLRRKIETDRANPRYVTTVYGVGYRFNDGPADA
ncbi:MAG: response regulator transcription factor [Vicinamibacterales bacterium]